jgi:hypothetical protein
MRYSRNTLASADHIARPEVRGSPITSETLTPEQLDRLKLLQKRSFRNDSPDGLEFRSLWQAFLASESTNLPTGPGAIFQMADDCVLA